MDLEKLRPAPWHAELFGDTWDLTYGPANDASERFSVLEDSDDERQAEAIKFAALARNAFDVMMRRGWGVYLNLGGQWYVTEDRQVWLWRDGHGYFTGPDPFTALVEADRWYRENVE